VLQSDVSKVDGSPSISYFGPSFFGGFMLKNVFVATLLVLASLVFQSKAQAQYYTPYPMSGPYPYSYMTAYPYYGSPYVTCFAQGLANGMVFYGVSYNVYFANQLAMNACMSTGQYCQYLGCR
jgi:hypothetical protein